MSPEPAIAEAPNMDGAETENPRAEGRGRRGRVLDHLTFVLFLAPFCRSVNSPGGTLVARVVDAPTALVGWGTQERHLRPAVLSGMDDDLYTDPMDIRVTEGAVVVLGPGPLCGAFTPDAAEQSALAMLEAVMKAREWVNPAVAPRS